MSIVGADLNATLADGQTKDADAHIGSAARGAIGRRRDKVFSGMLADMTRGMYLTLRKTNTRWWQTAATGGYDGDDDDVTILPTTIEGRDHATTTQLPRGHHSTHATQHVTKTTTTQTTAAP